MARGGGGAAASHSFRDKRRKMIKLRLKVEAAAALGAAEEAQQARWGSGKPRANSWLFCVLFAVSVLSGSFDSRSCRFVLTDTSPPAGFRYPSTRRWTRQTWTGSRSTPGLGLRSSRVWVKVFCRCNAVAALCCVHLRPTLYCCLNAIAST